MALTRPLARFRGSVPTFDRDCPKAFHIRSALKKCHTRSLHATCRALSKRAAHQNVPRGMRTRERDLLAAAPHVHTRMFLAQNAALNCGGDPIGSSGRIGQPGKVWALQTAGPIGQSSPSCFGAFANPCWPARQNVGVQTRDPIGQSSPLPCFVAFANPCWPGWQPLLKLPGRRRAG
eukprot:365817-Chlamydomonas_euryale.AAC.19